MTTTETTIPAAFAMRGKAVTGTYMGEPFTGIVRDASRHTLNHNVVVIFVDTPGFVYDGTERDGICLEVNCMTGGYEPTYGNDYGNAIRFA